MKKTIILSLILLVSAFLLNANAQPLHLSTGIGTYSMSDIRNYINDSKRYLPVEAKTFNDFPPFFNYHIAMRFKNTGKTRYFEPEVGFFSTGSRLNYVDYSGEMNIDFILTSFLIGFETGTYFSSTKKLNFGLYHQLSFYYTNFKVKEMIRLGNESESSSSGINLSHLAIEVGFFGEYDLPGRFSLTSGIGYSQQIVTLERASRKPDWSGFRFELGLIYTSNASK